MTSFLNSAPPSTVILRKAMRQITSCQIKSAIVLAVTTRRGRASGHPESYPTYDKPSISFSVGGYNTSITRSVNSWLAWLEQGFFQTGFDLNWHSSQLATYFLHPGTSRSRHIEQPDGHMYSPFLGAQPHHEELRAAQHGARPNRSLAWRKVLVAFLHNCRSRTLVLCGFPFKGTKLDTGHTHRPFRVVRNRARPCEYSENSSPKGFFQLLT